MAWSVGRPWAGDARALSFVELGRKFSRGRIDGEKKARGIALGLLKVTGASLAHLSREYDGQLAAERANPPQHAAAARRHDYIADGDAPTAYELLCKRTSFQPWLLKKVVKKAIDAQVAA